MKKYIIFFFILFSYHNANGSIKNQIIKHFNNINSIEFKFIQKIDNNNIEKGECIISYPKRIFCKYYDIYNKILVSNGKTIIINSDNMNNYVKYSLKKTPLNFILDKKFLISTINDIIEDERYPFYYVFDFQYENNIIKIFFDKKSLNLIGWETVDMYQNLVQTFIRDVKINIVLEESIFSIQKYIN